MRRHDESVFDARWSGSKTAAEHADPNVKAFAMAVYAIVVLLLLATPLWPQEDKTASRAGAAPMAFEKAIDELFAQGYPQRLEEYFCSLGTNPDLGFRWAGTSAERAVSRRVQEEMRSMGLRNVRMESVPLDVFEFTKASVTVGSHEMVASTFAGVAGTPRGGITAPVVYVKGGTAKDFDAVGDVSGKIVLIDHLGNSWWLSVPAVEAQHRKAAGIILTFTPEDPKYYSCSEEALGSFDAGYEISGLPIVYICRRDGDWVKSQIRQGPTEVTVILDVEVTRAEHGGVGYNVVGEIPGTSSNEQMIVLLSHQDAHFRAGMDDTAGMVTMLATAKAMCTSNCRPTHTIVFMATSAEEFGRVNSYYDWCIGSWWAITHEHGDWPGRTRAVINLEAMGERGCPLSMVSSPELKPWLTCLSGAESHCLPYGSSQSTATSTWADQWSFSASGIPAVLLDTSGLYGPVKTYLTRYHSNFETEDNIDWDYLRGISQFVHAAVCDLDDGLLPYDLTARAADLTAAVGAEQLISAGAEPSTVSKVIDAIASFEKDARTFHGKSQSVALDRIHLVDQRLLEVEKVLHGGLTALSPVDDSTVYPHQPVLNDAIAIRSCLVALNADQPDTVAALRALEGIGETAIGVKFSPAVHQKMMERKNPSYARLHWASLGKLPVPVDVMPEYRAIERGEIPQAVSSLEAKHRPVVAELNKRLQAMASVLSEVHALMEPLL